MKRLFLALFLLFAFVQAPAQEQIALSTTQHVHPAWVNSNARTQLNVLLIGLGSTIADYQPGNYIGTTNASAWLNSIGAAPSLTQSTGSAQPTINADGSLTFDGIAQYMQMTTTLVQPVVAIAVVNILVLTANHYILDGVTANSGGWFFNSGTSLQMYAGSSGPTLAVSSQVGKFTIYTGIQNGASSSLQANNDTAVTGNPGSGNPSGLTIGSRGGVAANFGNIEVKEIILLNAVPSAVTLNKIVYLLDRIYGAYSLSDANDFLNEIPTFAANDDVYRVAANGWY